MKIKTDPIKLGAEGRFRGRVYKADGSEVLEKRTGLTENVVTHYGAHESFFGVSMFGNLYAAVGTGVNEITRTATSLGNLAHVTPGSAAASRSGNEVDNGDGTSTLTLTRTIGFDLGATVGTFSEVGLCMFSTGSSLVAGQLIKDEFGDPTTVTVLADEQLVIEYTLEFTVPNAEEPVAPIIGTGTVTTPEGSSTYTVYQQPFFFEPSIGATSGAIRQGRESNYLAYAGSSGSLAYRKSGSGDSVSGSGGTRVVKSSSTSLSPSDYSNSALTYVVVGEEDLRRIVDPTSKYVKFSESNGNADGTFVIEFSPALNKAPDRSLGFQLEVTYSI